MTPRPPQTITLFIPDLEMGGAERVFVTLARQFLQLGHGVRLILARKTGPLLAELDPRVEIIDLAAGPPRPAWRFGLRTLWRLSRELRHRPPEAMLSTLTGANLVAIAARVLSRRRFPLVVREASSVANVRSWLRRASMRWLYRHADRVVVLTSHMCRQFSSALDLPLAHFCVINNPLDTERIEALSLATDELEEIRLLQPYVLALGRLVPEKDYATLIRAAASGTTPRIVILGEGPQREALTALVEHLGAAEKVSLPGARRNPYAWLRNAAGFALSSRWEGYPNALVEAMHFGLPIVATHYDDSLNEDVLCHYPSNLRITTPVGDARALADALVGMPLATAPPSHESAADLRQARQYLDSMSLPGATATPDTRHPMRD